jgi:acetoin utilization protein AcuB
MLVESVMTRGVITTEFSRSVQSAARLMHDGHFRHLPVVSCGRLVGIVSDRDLTAGRERRTVGEVMRTDIICVAPDTPIEVAARLMLENKIGALPVVENGKHEPSGIVTQSDLFAVLARLLGGEGPSTRLELCLSDPNRQLSEVTALAYERHVPITSLMTMPASNDGKTRRVVLRVGTIIAAPFVTALREAGIDVGLPQKPSSTAAPDV